MRVVLVGEDEDRASLRTGLNGSVDIVGEYDTIAAARASGVEMDAIVLASAQTASRLDDELVEPLTPREVQVLELLAEGLPNKAIAARLGISDQTVKVHVAAISGKLGAANRTDAVRLAVRRGLVTL
jgi:DNA-binding NarL/FixJ family response regulator